MSLRLVFIFGPWLGLVLVLTGCTGPTAAGTTAAPTTSVAADTPVRRQDSAADQVKDDVYYHQGQAITEGWNDFPWGASLSEFKARFPKALSTQADQTVWFTGEGPERFFGFEMPVAYHFDEEERFIAVSVTPPNRGVIQTLLNNMIDILGVPRSQKLEWRYDQVTIYAVQLSVIIKNLGIR